MFGIRHLIVCGAMMRLCKPSLCAAVSDAGGLGNLAAVDDETGEAFRAAVAEVRTLTSKPFMAGATILPSVRVESVQHRMRAG